MHTVQLDENKHILCVGGPEFTSHSCEPNAYFVFGGELGNIVSIHYKSMHITDAIVIIGN
jgi:SET domain-containing protein